MPEAGGPSHAAAAGAADPSPDAQSAIRAPASRIWICVGACVLAGAVHALSFAPANLPWLALAALALPLGLALLARGPGAALALGFAFGLGWFGVGISWIYISLHHYGELWAPLAALATAALAALLAVPLIAMR